MSSTNKTEHINLNSWIDSDVPKMDDFNSDNTKIDNEIYSHTSNANIHLSESEKAYLAKPYGVITYVGDGTSDRTIELSFGFTPSVCIVFERNALSGLIDFDNTIHYNFFGIATAYGSMCGLSLTDNNLEVLQGGKIIGNTEYRSYNEKSMTYIVIGFRLCICQ